MPINKRRTLVAAASDSRPSSPGAPSRRRASGTPDSVAASAAGRASAKPSTPPLRGRRPSVGVPGKPERLHKLLAQSGVGSRREMEELIAAGRVSLNGETARVGQTATVGDRVKVNGKLVQLRFSDRLPRVVLYHKPEGEIVSRNDPEHRPNVFTSMPRLAGARWVAVGRLDFNTSGLLLLTTSGELANRLMHPRQQLVREYAVRVLGELSPEARRLLLEGVTLDDGPARFTSLYEAGGEGANRWYRVALQEGRNREVRRLFETVGVVVSRLIRVRYGPFVLPPALKRGKVVELDAAAIRQLLADVGLGSSPSGHSPGRLRAT